MARKAYDTSIYKVDLIKAPPDPLFHSVSFNSLAQIGNGIRWCLSMKHGVAVWTYRNQVLNRIHTVVGFDLGQRPFVMYVDETGPDVAVESSRPIIPQGVITLHSYNAIPDVLRLRNLCR